MKAKFKYGDGVVIRVCRIRGIVVSTLVTDDKIKYEVGYPDKDGRPVYGCFYDIELEHLNSAEFGFGKKED